MFLSIFFISTLQVPRKTSTFFNIFIRCTHSKNYIIDSLSWISRRRDSCSALIDMHRTKIFSFGKTKVIFQLVLSFSPIFWGVGVLHTFRFALRPVPMNCHAAAGLFLFQHVRSGRGTHPKWWIHIQTVINRLTLCVRFNWNTLTRHNTHMSVYWFNSSSRHRTRCKT